jgi:hypothetical protein
MWILGVLDRMPDGTNANKILSQLPRTQSPDRLKDFLDDLCALDCIERIPMSDQHEGLIIYKLKEKGRATFTMYQSVDQNVRDVLGLVKVDIHGRI